MEGKLASVSWPKSATRLESVTKCIYYLVKFSDILVEGVQLGQLPSALSELSLGTQARGLLPPAAHSPSLSLDLSLVGTGLLGGRRKVTNYHNCSLAFTHMLCSVQPPLQNK